MIQITARRKRMAFFIVLGVCLVTLAVTLNVGWIILNWRQGIFFFFGIIFFLAIILGLILNTIYLVREIRRNEQHDSFINAVTHELKTPIASIRLYLETLQRHEVEEPQRQKFYQLMLDDSDRLLGTVQQVLKAGEVGYKKHPQYRTETDFVSLVNECVELARARHHLEPGLVRFEGSATGSGIRVHANPEEIRTAVSNLLDNAIKYSEGKVDVAVQVETPDEKHVQVKVRDKGVGIAPEDLKRIFKRFYRVPGRSHAHVKGTGLGLFIVRSIVRAHGGRVFAESRGARQGTTMILELPRAAS